MARLIAIVVLLSIAAVPVARADEAPSVPGIRASAERVRFTHTSLGPTLRMTPGPIGLTSKKVRAGMAYGMLGLLIGAGFGTMADGGRPDGGRAKIMAPIGGIIGAIAGAAAPTR